VISTWSRLIVTVASEDPSNPDGRVQRSFLGRGVKEELGHDEPLRLFEVGQERFRRELSTRSTRTRSDSMRGASSRWSSRRDLATVVIAALLFLSRRDRR
jgi:hypothetical protein